MQYIAKGLRSRDYRFSPYTFAALAAHCFGFATAMPGLGPSLNEEEIKLVNAFRNWRLV